MSRTKTLDFRLASHRELRRRVFLRDDFTCQICSWRPADPPGPEYDGRYAPYERGRGLQLDHIIPLVAGGPRTDIRNLQTLCHPCNSMKSGRELTYGLGSH